MVSGAKFRSTRAHADVMGDMAVKLGVDQSKLVFADQTMDTADETEAARRWFVENGIEGKRLVVVSAAMHLPRAAMLLEGSGLDYTMAPTDFRALDAPWYRFSSLHLRDVDAVVHEYVGMLWTRLSR